MVLNSVSGGPGHCFDQPADNVEGEKGGAVPVDFFFEGVAEGVFSMLDPELPLPPPHTQPSLRMKTKCNDTRSISLT